VEVGKSQAIAGKLIKIRSLDLATEAGQIAKTQIICYDDKEVGPFGFVGRLHVAVKLVVVCYFSFKDEASRSDGTVGSI
jgi:hypothetical protein